jgi:serine/threonine-protein kinase
MTDAQPPAEIGRYKVLGVLGRGAMGIVYKAHDPAIDRKVAIKVVRIDASDARERAEAIDRFRLEVQAAGRCSHAAIVGVYDFLDKDGDPAIVMELIEGDSLHAHLRDPGKRAALPVPGVVLRVLDALGYAHGQGIIHRDIKPANILLSAAGQVKIADFGIARLSGLPATLSGEVLGTPSYMAPEQLRDGPVDRRADLFAVGAILYEILAGRPPFAGKTVHETLARVGSVEAADLAPVAAAGGQAYVDVLRRALAKDPAQRFQSADDFAAALEADGMATVVMTPRVPAPTARTWDPALLQRVEQELARFVGPMARLIVTRTAHQAEDTAALVATLARTLPSASDRSQFLRAVGGGRVEPSIGGRAEGPRTTAGTLTPRAAGETLAPKPATPAGGVVISPEASAAAQAALVQYVGPMARLLVREAESKATSGRQFIDLLCAHVTKPGELAELRRRLRAEVEPKLR